MRNKAVTARAEARIASGVRDAMLASRREAAASYRAMGLCTSCRRETAVAGRTHCESCAANYREHTRRYIAEAKEAGLCRYCRKKPATIGVGCAGCQKKRAAARKRKRRERWEQRQCVECGGEIEFEREGLKSCRSCAYKQQRRVTAFRRRQHS